MNQKSTENVAASSPLERIVMPDVLDACCGTRMMWIDKNDKRAIFVDCRTESFSIAPGRAYKNGAVLHVAPDKEADFTKLPFENEAFFHVVFDPPHHTSKRLGSTGTGVIEKKYGRLGDDWKEMIADGFTECFRVLKPKGTLIFKWADTEIPLREILKLTPEKPLYGHKSGKKAQTHWVAFLKA
jgi:SAM-dependent methyltransferase